MKMLTAHTAEIDDVNLAVSEILRQLDPEKNLRKNSVGILSCYSEFIDSGVVEALCERLPFDVVGCTTLGNGISGESGMMLLGLSVLTSDDVSFAAVKSDSLNQDLKSVEQAYAQAARSLPDQPSMAIAFLPMILHRGGELLMDELNRVSGGIPIFGTIACDHLPDYSSSATIYNGGASRDALSMVLISGNVRPHFLVTAISDRKLQKQRAVITASEGCLLREVNDMPAMKYMETLGLLRGNGIEGMTAIPFIVDYNDGTPPMARALYLVTPEGHIVCGGAMPEGSALAIGSIDYEDVLETTQQVTGKISELAGEGGVLLFPCLSRNTVLGTDVMAELDKISGGMGEKAPYHVCYSGGELCPLYDEKEQLANRFHNFSIIACIFQ